MTLTFLETPRFMAVRDGYFVSDDNFRVFQQTLLDNPGMGNVIPGTNGVRKMRVADPRRGKGKRGGLRVIYQYMQDVNVVLLLSVYDKNEADDLSSEIKRAIVQEVELIRLEHIATNAVKKNDERKT